VSYPWDPYDDIPDPSEPFACFSIVQRPDPNDIVDVFVVVIKITDAFDIKDELKKHGYYWRPDEKIWFHERDFPSSKRAWDWIDKHAKELEELGTEIEIRNDRNKP